MVSKDWTYEEAWEANQAVLAGNPQLFPFDPSLPFSQWRGLHELDQYRALYEQGDKFALMLAIRECARASLPMPDWVATGYISAFDTILNYRSKDWNEVFGKPIPKGANLAALRKKRELEHSIFNEVVAIRKSDPNIAIDAGLFERVGKKFNIGKTLAEEYYYGLIEEWGWNPR